MDAKIFRLVEIVKSRLALAYYEAKWCHEKLFKNPRDFKTEQKALVYLYRAARHMDLAYSIYQSYLEELEHYSITPVFDAFNVFYEEITENFATDHSHQWSDIEFRRYKKTLYDWVPESREE